MRTARDQGGRGQVRPTPRQAEVVALIADGLSTKEIAQRLGISANAVKGHITKLLRKYDVANRAALVDAVAHYVDEGARKERERFHELLMNAPVAIAITRGPKHVIEFLNRTFLGGLDGAEVVGRPLPEVYAERFGPAEFVDRDTVLATGERRVVTERPAWPGLVTDDAVNAFVKLVHEPIRDDAGAVDGVMTFAIDVSELVRERRRAQRLSEEQRAVLDLLPVAVVIADPQGKLTINHAAATMLDLGAEALPSLRDAADASAIVDAMSGRRVLPEDTALGRALHGENSVGTYVVERPRGPVRLKVRGEALRDGAGAIIGAVALLERTELVRPPV